MIRSQKSDRIIFIVGPTAVGKSAVAACLARKLDSEVVSCDSMQVYKGMRIISSYPDRKFLKAVRHRLISSVPANREYNVSRYRRQALREISRIRASGKVPVFSGGTGLYMSVLTDGIFKVKPISRKIRERLYRRAEIKGSSYLHKRLKKVDPEAAGRIHPNDTKRTIRALEVFEGAGKPISLLQKQRSGLRADYDVRIFCLNRERPELYRRIDSRVETMFRSGLLNEVKRLLRSGLSKTSCTALGIKEVKRHIDGEYDLEEAKRLLKLNTRRYAKRQLTWFRKDKGIIWINISEGEGHNVTADRIWKKLS